MLTRIFYIFYNFAKTTQKNCSTFGQENQRILPFEFFDVRSGSFKSNTKHSLLLDFGFQLGAQSVALKSALALKRANTKRSDNNQLENQPKIMSN